MTRTTELLASTAHIPTIDVDNDQRSSVEPLPDIQDQQGHRKDDQVQSRAISKDAYAAYIRSSSEEPPSEDPSGFYSMAQTVALTTLSRVTLWRLMRDGKFPRSVSLTAGRVGFPRGAVNEWIRERTEAANAKAS